MTGDETALRRIRTPEQREASIPGRARFHLAAGGTLDPSLPSTVVDCTGPRPRLLREGRPAIRKPSSLIEIVHG